MIEWFWLVSLVADPAPNSPSSSRPTEPIKINILVKQPEQKCGAQSADEIVVCAEKSDNESQRLRPITNAEIYEKDESKAEFSISENVRVAAEVDSNQLGGGVTGKSIMARVKIKF